MQMALQLLVLLAMLALSMASVVHITDEVCAVLLSSGSCVIHDDI